MKGLINLKNKDHKCFMWCHVRLINPTNSHPERISKQDRFQIQVNVFGYENKVYLLYLSKKCYNQTLNNH